MPTSKHNAEPSTMMVGVYFESRRIGHVLQRGCDEFEAYNHNQQSLGFFNTEDEATTAIWKAAR
jgi:hypothetical protein